MIRDRNFNDALDLAIDALARGASPGEILARFPKHASRLRPVLESAATMASQTRYLPPTERLARADDHIRAAVAETRLRTAEPTSRPRATRWSRRVAIATTSVPVLAVVITALGVGSAAAAVAVTTDIPESLVHQVEHATRDLEAFLPGHNSSPEDNPGLNVPPTHGSAPGAGENTHTPGPPFDMTTITGSLADIRGSVFELVSSGGTYNVQLDAKTIVTAELVEGAEATVEGFLVGQNQLHANRVAVLHEAPPESATPDPAPGEPDPTLTPTPKSTHTPPGLTDKTKTPGPPDKSKTPGPPDKTRTPGSSGGNGDGSSSDE